MKNLVSIVVPLFNEQENVPLLTTRLREVLEKQNIKFEIILIDDGSRDDTFKAIQAEAAKDQRVAGVRFGGTMDRLPRLWPA